MAEDNTTGDRKTPGRTNPKRGEAAVRGFDPFDYLLTRAINSTDQAERDWLALELMPYCKPKLKAVEVTGDMNMTVTVTIGGTD